MIYRTKEENRIKRKLTRIKRKKTILQNEIALLNLRISQTDDRNLILRREIILKDIREIDVVIKQYYGKLRNPNNSFKNCIYGIIESFPDLGTRA